MTEIIHVTDDSFENDVMKSKLPVLLDFWAEWCGPCKMIAPVLDDIAKTYDGKLIVAKINVDENTQIPQKYGVRGIPSLLLFVAGNVEGSQVGAVSKAQLATFIDDKI